MEIAFLLNKIYYELETFIENTESVSIVTDSSDEIEVNQSMLGKLADDPEYLTIKESLNNIFTILSNQLGTITDLMAKMSKPCSKIVSSGTGENIDVHKKVPEYQQEFAKKLLLCAIDFIKDSLVLDENGGKDQAIQKYTQSQFLLDELLIEIDKANKLDSKNGKLK